MMNLTKGSFHSLLMVLVVAAMGILQVSILPLGHILLNMVTPHKGIPPKDTPRHLRATHQLGIHLAPTRKLVMVAHPHHPITQGMEWVEWGDCLLEVLLPRLLLMVLIKFLTVLLLMVLPLGRDTNSTGTSSTGTRSTDTSSTESLSTMASSSRGNLESMVSMAGESLRNGSDSFHGISTLTI